MNHLQGRMQPLLKTGSPYVALEKTMDVWLKSARCKRVGADEHSLGCLGSGPQCAAMPLKM